MKFIELRPATMDDAEDLLLWKNDPTTRKFSILTQDRILWSDHLRYLETHLKNTQIILIEGKSAGAIRTVDGEVSIWIDLFYRGYGIGYLALGKVVKPGMFARIVNGNLPSLRLFLSLGFKPIEYHEKGYYLLQL